jgi:hypothetical protein
LLAEPERVILRRLAVFAGPFSLEAAAAVAASPELSVPDAFNVSRTVDDATPTRRAISLIATPAVFKRSTSRTWRIAVLSAGIVPSHGKPKERTLSGPAETPCGDYPGDIIPE